MEIDLWMYTIHTDDRPCNRRQGVIVLLIFQTFVRIKTVLDNALSLLRTDERLKLVCRKRVNVARVGSDEHEGLASCECC